MRSLLRPIAGLLLGAALASLRAQTVDLTTQTVLLTGLTRDGNFLIENGRITKPVNNFRFNESPVNVLNNVVAMGPSVRARGGEGASSISAPAILVDNFHFSSVSKAS